MLTINTLGFFQITDGKTCVDDSAMHSIMLMKVFSYLMMYRQKTLSTEDICNAIWQDEESDNPAGALKNLMYRLRKTLSDYYDMEFVITNRGSYRFNPDIDVNLDVEQFEQLISQAKQENQIDLAIEKYEAAISLYQGDFLGKLMDMSWVMTLNTYYHSLMLSAVKSLADLYEQKKEYEKLDALVTNALRFENADEQLFCFQIEARMRMGNIALALDSYDKAREIMEKELGIRKTTVLNKVYDELLSMSKGEGVEDIETISTELTEEEQEGVYMCGYPVFKEIYHLEARKSSRNFNQETLLLLTVEPKDGVTPEVDAFRVKQVMAALETIIRRSLRVGDVAARYSDSQYILLLATCSKELAMHVGNRLINRLYHLDDKYKKSLVTIQIEDVTAGTMVE